ncbi:polysaccharide deacetylase family protein [Deinococcus ruber]|uniref:Polysaccharide deacetylase familiy protein n=1 Tax=Deinococcus ruber TaxID=1848197 RepID=A0A918FFQ2_9DEIO|nr:polysaccharide deacetylase family protein [Deinococcus ruber]GGR35177.1 polysaccharide deacetylase familiy protein [Deinococcus ruber]
MLEEPLLMTPHCSRRHALRLLTGTALWAAGQTLAAPSKPAGRLPLPLVQPSTFPAVPVPGAVQPLAPGTRPTAALPRLSLPELPELHRCEYAGNGRMEAAHAVLLVNEDDATHARALHLAHDAVTKTFAARPSLAEVAVSVYRAQGYQGFGGVAPLLTASVPVARLGGFLDTALSESARYERLWLNPDAVPPEQLEPSRELERAPVFVGSVAGLAAQRVKQLAAQLVGGTHGGLLFHGRVLGGPAAALSFDDAPHPIYAPLLLDTLKRARVHATFFCIGRNARAYPYYVQDIAADGHEVGNHTYHHVRLTGLPMDTVEDELRRCNEVLRGITGKPVRFFRPPGGRYSPQTLEIARARGLVTTFWTDDPADFNNPGQKVLESRLAGHLRQGGIVLLHDNVLESLRVLPQFVAYAQRQGVELDTVGELAGLESGSA